MANPSQESDPLSRIRTGMSVFDVNGRHIGTVDLVVPGEAAVGKDSPVLRGAERYIERDYIGTVSAEGVQLKHPTNHVG